MTPEEGMPPLCPVQVLATDERFDESALRWADLAVLKPAMPLESAAME
jgi:aminopeptidase